MNLKNKICAFLVFFISFSPVMKSQVDTLFWFAAPWVTPDNDSNYPMAFRIATFANNTTVRIKQVASSYDTTFTVSANSRFSKSLSHLRDSLESKPADQVLRTGFRITSDFPITVVYDFISDTISGGAGTNPETYSLKGQNGLGTEFITPFQTIWNNTTLTGDNNGDGVITQPYSMFCICATENNTVVRITPKCNVAGGHTAGLTYSVTLNAGQVYTCQNVSQLENFTGQNLSGSIVVSDKPVAITVSDDAVNPSGGGTCIDLIGDQIVPTDVIGNEYAVSKGFLNAGSDESIFFVATKNFTTVTVNDGVTTQTFLMNQGDTRSFQLSQNLTYVSSDKSIYAIHLSGYGCELAEAILPPLNCSGSQQVNFTRDNSQSFTLNILCKSSAINNFLLDGNAALIPAGAFAAVPATGGQWMAAQISYSTAQLAVNTVHSISNTAGNFSFGVINGDVSSGSDYHYLSSFITRVYASAGADQLICTNDTVMLNGNISGGTTTGTWTALNGTGTIGNPAVLSTTYMPSSSDTAQGSVTFVLSSTGNCTPVTDTVVVAFKQSPHVDAGADMTFCKNNLASINLKGILNYAAGSNWSGGNGGVFGNAGSAFTSFRPSAADLAADSIYLTLTSTGSFSGCPEMTDSVKLVFTIAPQVIAGSDISVCSNNANISFGGFVDGATTTGVWTTNGSGTFSPNDSAINVIYSPSPTDTTYGSVFLALTSTNNGNCLAVSDTLTLSIVNAPSITITSADTACGNAGVINVACSVTPGFGVKWNTYGTGSFANINGQNTTYTIGAADVSAGFVDLTVSTLVASCKSVRDSIRLNFVIPPLANAGGSQSFCANAPLQLNGSVTGVTSTGVWSSTGSGSFNPGNQLLSTQYIPSVGDVSAGVVKLILTSSNNGSCNADVDTLIATFISPPTASFTTNEVCQGASTKFTNTSTTPSGTLNNHLWDFGDLSSTSISKNPTHTYPSSGTYTATLIVSATTGCADTVSLPVVIDPIPTADFTYSIPCVAHSVNFTDISFVNSGSIVSWNYSFLGSPPNSTLQNPSHVFSDVDTFAVYLNVTSDKGCVGTVSYNVNILPAPVASFTMSGNPVVALESVSFTDQSTGGPLTGWIWNFGDTTGSNQQNVTHSYSNGGNYDVSLVVTDQNGCTDTSTNEITIALVPVLPTAFTPNGDHNNDVFFVRGGPFNKMNFRVFNSWGTLVFSSTDQTQGWDGTYQGVDQPIGVYVWTVDVEIADGRIIKKSGDITLIR